ncbi:MAG TPA: hypothetical protein VKU41_20195 [Polyangiaceae bacterium]|nr:hypothetical protein [Polyangiaceae bacterium]
MKLGVPSREPTWTARRAKPLEHADFTVRQRLAAETLRRAERAATRGDIDLDRLEHLRALAYCERESERELAAAERKGPQRG